MNARTVAEEAQLYLQAHDALRESASLRHYLRAGGPMTLAYALTAVYDRTTDQLLGQLCHTREDGLLVVLRKNGRYLYCDPDGVRCETVP